MCDVRRIMLACTMLLMFFMVGCHAHTHTRYRIALLDVTDPQKLKLIEQTVIACTRDIGVTSIHESKGAASRGAEREQVIVGWKPLNQEAKKHQEEQGSKLGLIMWYFRSTHIIELGSGKREITPFLESVKNDFVHELAKIVPLEKIRITHKKMLLSPLDDL